MAKEETYSDELLAHIEINSTTGQRFFITDAGVRIGLKPISVVYQTRYQMEYAKAYPPPVPPVIEVEIGIGNKKERAYQYHSDDPYYKILVEEYESTKNLNFVLFLVKYGTTMPVPTDFATMFEAKDELERRADYVSSLLISQEETKYFVEAVSSQTSITEAALRESAKRFRGNGAGPERSPVPVLEQTGQNYPGIN